MAANTPSYDVFQGAERGLLPRPRSRHRPERMQPVAYLYLLPVIVSAIIFTIGPFLYTIYISFTNYKRLRNFQEFDWIGWRNYERVFEAGSEINANPRDTADHPHGVWSLAPFSRSTDEKHKAIGESDRMTLKFRKPANAAGRQA